MDADEPKPPPGRQLHELDTEAQRLAAIGLDGLCAHLRGQLGAIRAGTPAYHELSRMVGTASTAAAALRRHLAAAEA